MIISMCDYSKLIVVTNRHLCKGDFLEQLAKVLALKPCALILREKDLNYAEYEALASKVKALCDEANVPMFVHTYISLASALKCGVHLSFENWKAKKEALALAKQNGITKISISCHSLEEAKYAEAKGADQIILGTIFATNCKPGKEGAGLEFLKEVCQSCHLPVYAIGGIKENNLQSVLDAGAVGGCMMSGFVALASINAK